jgi:hypothetical protein
MGEGVQDNVLTIAKFYLTFQNAEVIKITIFCFYLK